MWADKNSQFKRELQNYDVTLYGADVGLEQRTETTREYFQHDRISFAPWLTTLPYEIEQAQWPEEVPTTAAAPQAPGASRSEPPSSMVQPASRPPAEPRRAVMLTRAVSRGSLLSAASVEPTQVPAREADSLLISEAQFLDQMEAVRDLPAGVPLRQTDVRPAVLVRQGQWVTMTVGQGTGFTITVRLEALQDGRLGDRVMLRNTESGRTVSGVVTGMNAAKGA